PRVRAARIAQLCTSSLLAARRPGILAIERERAVSPIQLKRMIGIVVIKRDVVAVVGAVSTLDDEVVADVRTAALQIPAQIHAATLARFDDPVAQELHVLNALVAAAAAREPPGVLRRPAPHQARTVTGSA